MLIELERFDSGCPPKRRVWLVSMNQQ